MLGHLADLTELREGVVFGNSPLFAIPCDIKFVYHSANAN